MTSCYNMEMTSADTRIYATTYSTFSVCIACYIIIGTFYIVHLAKKRFNQVYDHIGNQQEEIMGYTQAKMDQFIVKYDVVLNKLEDDNANIRDYVADLEREVIYLQSVVPSEVAMRRIHDDANANYANLGERINSIRHQTMRDIQELEEKYSLLNRYVQMDDEHKQVLIGYYPGNPANIPIFCPKYTTELCKYLENTQSYFLLSSLAQLPNYQTFVFADLYYSTQTNKRVQVFMDINQNVIANAASWTHESVACGDDYKIVAYNTAAQKVHDYCKQFGVNCV